MESQNEQCGYSDDIFITEPPDYLRCVVCSLILRDPVQILTCGHLFCSACFTQYAESRTTELLCPVDRDVVDPSKVHEDVAMQRIIGNLRVRCVEHEGGCEWSGDLRELEKHCQTCVFVKQQLQVCPNGSNLETEKLVHELTDRVTRCEISLADKDREVADRDKEILSLKHEIREMRESHTVLTNKVNVLSEKYEGMRKLQVDFDERLKDKDEEIADLKLRLQEDDLTDLLSVSLPPEFEIESESLDDQISWIDEFDPLEVQLHRGKVGDIIFSMPGNCRMEFKNRSTASLPEIIAQYAVKAWYEVEFLEFSDPDKYNGSRCQIGWASHNFTSLGHRTEKGVGEVARSYARSTIGGFNSNAGDTFIEGKRYVRDDLYSKRRARLRDAQGRKFVGVALDMELGQMNYSINGEWGLTLRDTIRIFNGSDRELFPALTGANVTIEINVGDRPFAYGPPNDSYKSLLEINSERKY